MFNLFEKILNKSNSYRYYKSQNSILNKKIKKKNKKLIDYESNNFINETIYTKLNNLENEYNIIRKYLVNELNFIKNQNNLENLRKKSKNQKINIVFIVNFKITIFDSLIDLLEKNSFFNPLVILIPYNPSGQIIFDEGLNDIQTEEYNSHYEFYKNKNYNVIKGYNEKNKIFIDIELELNPDIVFYSSPWEKSFPIEYRIENLPKNILFCYIPYGIYMAQMQNDQFNKKLHNKAWKVFCETPKHKYLACKYSDNGGSNVVVTGYPKMDPLIDNSYKKMPKIWKSKNSEKKKAIYAPHHSIGDNFIGFSTFLENYNFFYKYAKEHDEIEWVFKPHPQLIHKNRDFEKEGINELNTDDKLKKYFKKWDDLPNSTVYECGDYLNIFKHSDIMITDSVSFLAEYLYFNKPGIFLTRPEQKFNEFGELIIDAWYKVRGNDFEGIDELIQNILFKEKDPIKDTRDYIFNQFLNTDGVKASENILNYLKYNILSND